MSLFEYVTVILAMILALAMGRLLRGVARIVEMRREVVGSASGPAARDVALPPGVV